MRLSSKILLGSFGLLAACSSSREPASLDRGPASAGVPIGPERTNAAFGGRNPQSGANVGGVPIGPERRPTSGTGGHAGGELGRGPGDRDKPPQEEIRSGCGLATMLRVNMGGGFSAHDVLSRVASEGTFSGRVRIPTWRNVSASGNGPQWVVDYATAVEYDRQVLGRWLNGADPSVSASDVYEAVRDSEPFSYAAQFVNTNGVVRVYRDQYDIGHRLATMLAVMIAASQQGDPDCVEYLTRDWVPKIIPGEDAQKLLAQIRSREAAQLVKEGRIVAEFQKVAANRKKIHEDIEAVDRSIAEKEKQNVSELERIRFDLKESYFALRSELTEIAPCRDLVGLQEKLYASSSTPEAFVNKLVDDCKTRISSRLSSMRNEQLVSQGRIKQYEERRKVNEGALKIAQERGRTEEIRRRSEAIEAYDKKIEAEKTKNDALAERAQTYADYMAFLVKEESSSISVEVKRINELVGENKRRSTNDYLKPEMQQIERYRDDLKANSTNYLTLGFFGGFEGSEPRSR
jgi:hypothetical protein